MRTQHLLDRPVKVGHRLEVCERYVVWVRHLGTQARSQLILYGLVNGQLVQAVGDGRSGCVASRKPIEESGQFLISHI